QNASEPLARPESKSFLVFLESRTCRAVRPPSRRATALLTAKAAIGVEPPARREQHSSFNRAGGARCARLASGRGRHGSKFVWSIDHCDQATSVQRANLRYDLTGA